MKFPLKYKAAVLVVNKPLKLYDLEFRGPLKVGQVLLR